MPQHSLKFGVLLSMLYIFCFHSEYFMIFLDHDVYKKWQVKCSNGVCLLLVKDKKNFSSSALLTHAFYVHKQNDNPLSAASCLLHSHPVHPVPDSQTGMHKNMF